MISTELVVLYFTITYCLGMIGLILCWNKYPSHSDQVQLLALGIASPLIPIILSLAIGALVLWIFSAPLRWCGTELIRAGMELLHPHQLQKKVSGIWKA